MSNSISEKTLRVAIKKADSVIPIIQALGMGRNETTALALRIIAVGIDANAEENKLGGVSFTIDQLKMIEKEAIEQQQETIALNLGAEVIADV